MSFTGNWESACTSRVRGIKPAACRFLCQPPLDLPTRSIRSPVAAHPRSVGISEEAPMCAGRAVDGASSRTSLVRGSFPC